MGARKQLHEQSLIIFQDPLYQVLSLPEKKAEQYKTANMPPKQDRQTGFQELKLILENVTEQ